MAAEGGASEPNMTSGFWFLEEVTPDLHMKMKLDRIMFDEKSKFQRAQVVETGPFGKTLVLDGKTQSAMADEYIYHESLVHPALLLHENPKTVYIGGGGELATAREILRHPSVERVVMVDIDEVVVDICRKELPEWGDGCMEDKRLEVHYDDAKGFLERDSATKYDVIIMDIADPIEAGPGIALYFKEFYDFASKERLNPGGILVTQSGPGSHFNSDECFSTIHQTLRSCFDHVLPYTSDIPSFGCNWAFNLAFNKDSGPAKIVGADAPVRPNAQIVDALTCAEIDKRIAERIPAPLRFLDGVAFKGIMGITKAVAHTLDNEKRIMTKDTPVFMY